MIIMNECKHGINTPNTLGMYKYIRINQPYPPSVWGLWLWSHTRISRTCGRTGGVPPAASSVGGASECPTCHRPHCPASGSGPWPTWTQCLHRPKGSRRFAQFFPLHNSAMFMDKREILSFSVTAKLNQMLLHCSPLHNYTLLWQQKLLFSFAGTTT